MPQYKRLDLHQFTISLSEIVVYLRDEASPAVAQRLFDEVDEQISGVLNMPNLYPVYEFDARFHKMSLANWSYVLFYSVDEKQKVVVVYDIIHQSRDIPTLLKKRVP